MSRHNRPVRTQNNANLVSRTEIRGHLFTGPLPPPEQFEAYERIQPGAADRILRLAEQQSQHRRDIETKSFDSQITLSLRAQISAVVLAFTTVAATVYCATIGQTSVAITLGGTTLVSLATLFFRSLSSLRKKEPDDKPSKSE